MSAPQRPLMADMVYERAVDVARSSENISPGARRELCAYLVQYWPELAERLLNRMVARNPELVATAMIDLNFAGDSSVVAYAYGTDGKPVMLEGRAELPPGLAAAS